MDKDGKSNKIQVIIVHIKQSELSTANPLNRLLICSITLSAHICIVVFPAVKHIQLWSFHSTDVMEVGAAETAPSSVRHIKILKILCSCSVLFFSCALVSYRPLPKLEPVFLVSNMNIFNSSHGLEISE